MATLYHTAGSVQGDWLVKHDCTASVSPFREVHSEDKSISIANNRSQALARQAVAPGALPNRVANMGAPNVLMSVAVTTLLGADCALRSPVSILAHNRLWASDTAP